MGERKFNFFLLKSGVVVAATLGVFRLHNEYGNSFGTKVAGGLLVLGLLYIFKEGLSLAKSVEANRESLSEEKPEHKETVDEVIPQLKKRQVKGLKHPTSNPVTEVTRENDTLGTISGTSPSIMEDFDQVSRKVKKGRAKK